MSSSKKKKDKDPKPSRKNLVAEIEDLNAKLKRSKARVKKLNTQLKSLAEELRESLLASGKTTTTSSPSPLTALPTPPIAPTDSEIARAAYHLYLERSHTGTPGSPECDWFQAQSLLWQEAAQDTHLSAVRLSQSPRPADPQASIPTTA